MREGRNPTAPYIIAALGDSSWRLLPFFPGCGRIFRIQSCSRQKVFIVKHQENRCFICNAHRIPICIVKQESRIYGLHDIIRQSLQNTFVRIGRHKSLTSYNVRRASCRKKGSLFLIQCFRPAPVHIFHIIFGIVFCNAFGYRHIIFIFISGTLISGIRSCNLFLIISYLRNHQLYFAVRWSCAIIRLRCCRIGSCTFNSPSTCRQGSHCQRSCQQKR